MSFIDAISCIYINNMSNFNKANLLFLLSGRRRVHHAARDAWNRDGHLQDGRLSHEDARGRVDAGEEDGQDLPADGQKPGRKIVFGRIYRRRKEWSVHRKAAPVWSASIALKSKLKLIEKKVDYQKKTFIESCLM